MSDEIREKPLTLRDIKEFIDCCAGEYPEHLDLPCYFAKGPVQMINAEPYPEGWPLENRLESWVVVPILEITRITNDQCSGYANEYIAFRDSDNDD